MEEQTKFEIEELWKDIPGYEGLYQVSNYGRIKSFKLKKERILKLRQSRCGYLLVVLYNFEHQSKCYSVHRLVAQCFVKNPNNKLTVNHKDENKLNNNANNLEWLTSLEQNLYGTRIQRLKQKLYKKVNQYDLDGNYIKTWNSIKDVETKLGISSSHITGCCKHNYGRKTIGGYRWEYANE